MSNRSLPSGQMYQTSHAGATPLGTPAEAATELAVADDPILLSTLSYNLGRGSHRFILPNECGECDAKWPSQA